MPAEEHLPSVPSIPSSFDSISSPSRHWSRPPPPLRSHLTFDVRPQHARATTRGRSNASYCAAQVPKTTQGTPRILDGQHAGRSHRNASRRGRARAEHDVVWVDDDAGPIGSGTPGRGLRCCRQAVACVRHGSCRPCVFRTCPEVGRWKARSSIFRSDSWVLPQTHTSWLRPRHERVKEHHPIALGTR